MEHRLAAIMAADVIVSLIVRIGEKNPVFFQPQFVPVIFISYP